MSIKGYSVFPKLQHYLNLTMRSFRVISRTLVGEGGLTSLQSGRFKWIYLTPKWYPIRCYHFRLEWTWEWWQWRGAPHSPKLQHYWILMIRLFSVICRTLVDGRLSYFSTCSRCILQPQPTGSWDTRCVCEGGLTSLQRCRDAVGVFYSPRRLKNLNGSI